MPDRLTEDDEPDYVNELRALPEVAALHFVGEDADDSLSDVVEALVV
jgi:hypothetical protein